LVSVTGVGYEQHAYVWIGYGVWTQLWAQWTLPLAWGYSWRAIRHGNGWPRAVLFIALTIALHFETGYLALSVPAVWSLVAGRPLGVRVRRAAILIAGSLLATAWVTVPLLTQRPWTAVNEAVQHTGLVNGYGAHQVIEWLVTGQLLDHGRLPVIVVIAAVGFGVAWLAWSSDADGRALLVALGVCLLFAFGRTTFGSLVDVIPGSRDLFFRRFMMGVQLAALLLAGRGAGWLMTTCRQLIADRARRLSPNLTVAIALLAGVVVLTPAWRQLGAYDRRDGEAITAQRHADAREGAELDRLIAVIRRDGGGRTYAGMPSNWGANFTVGTVPVFKYLESRNVDEVGYTLRTASLMTDPEYFLDERQPADYRLFGIRYLLLPPGRRPPVPALLEMRSGPFRLWMIHGGGYVQTGRIAGTIAADRTDVGRRAIPMMRSGLAAAGDYLSVRYGSHAANGPLPPAKASGALPPGAVATQTADLADGHATATVRMRRPGVAVLSASYDPGWTVTVNGRRRPTRMVAPALVAVTVPAGTSNVVFRYRGYSDYPELLALAVLVLIAAASGPTIARRVRHRGL
jgi:Bacterial membrane protein YfhO